MKDIVTIQDKLRICKQMQEGVKFGIHFFSYDPDLNIRWGSPIFPLIDHQHVSLSICTAVPSLRLGLPTNPGVKKRGAYVGTVEEMMCVVCECYKGSRVVMDVIWRRLCVSMI